jgi:integrase
MSENRGGDKVTQTATPDMTLSDFFENHYRPIRLLGKSTYTVIDYTYGLSRLNKFMGYDVRLSDLTDEFLSQYMAAMMDKICVASVNHNRRLIIALWRFAFKKKLIDRLPEVDRLVEYRRVPVAWSMEEYGKILETAKQLEGVVARKYLFGKQKFSSENDNPANKWWPALLLLAYDTGLRINAILSIKPEYIDFEKGWLRIPAETQKQKADQTFMLHSSTLEILREVKPRGGFVFYWPLDKTALYIKFRQIIEKAGLPTSKGTGTLFHKIRKTTATMVADKLGDAAASAYLGHSCMQVTERYLDPTKIHRIQAVDVLPRPELPQPEAFNELVRS